MRVRFGGTSAWRLAAYGLLWVLLSAFCETPGEGCCGGDPITRGQPGIRVTMGTGDGTAECELAHDGLVGSAGPDPCAAGAVEAHEAFVGASHSRPRILTLKNVGDGALTVSSISVEHGDGSTAATFLLSADGEHFGSLADDLGPLGFIRESANLYLAISCAIGAEGEHAATLLINSDANASCGSSEPSILRIPLHGSCSCNDCGGEDQVVCNTETGHLDREYPDPTQPCEEDGTCAVTTVPSFVECPHGCDAEADRCRDCDDPDGDGYGDGDGCLGHDDCGPDDSSVYPGAAEVACDGMDNDCDATTVDAVDGDRDGHTACDGDCEDGDASIHPDAVEDCADATDNDCNDRADCEDESCELDPACSACVDADLDGHDAGDPITCPAGDDCDDSDPGSFPGAREVCDGGVDNDCDSTTSETCGVRVSGHIAATGGAATSARFHLRGFVALPGAATMSRPPHRLRGLLAFPSDR